MCTVRTPCEVRVLCFPLNRQLAQKVERQSEALRVVGSIPSLATDTEEKLVRDQTCFENNVYPHEGYGVRPLFLPPETRQPPRAYTQREIFPQGCASIPSGRPWFESKTPHHLWRVCAWCAFVRNTTLPIPRARHTRRVSKMSPPRMRRKKNRLGAGAALKAERVLARGVGFETSFFLSVSTIDQGLHAIIFLRRRSKRVRFPCSPPLTGNARWLDSPPSSLVETETSPRRSGFYALVYETNGPGSIPGEGTKGGLGPAYLRPDGTGPSLRSSSPGFDSRRRCRPDPGSKIPIVQSVRAYTQCADNA